jgi:putative IMPACT (imprinted ancient) family translation regulator
MIEDISFINNIKNFKQSLFQGTIFKFSRSEKAIELINSIKKEIHSHYAKNLDTLHLEKNAELIAKNLIKTLKNQDFFLKILKKF